MPGTKIPELIPVGRHTNLYNPNGFDCEDLDAFLSDVRTKIRNCGDKADPDGLKRTLIVTGNARRVRDSWDRGISPVSMISGRGGSYGEQTLHGWKSA